MAYRNKTYICFDADSDIRYYRLMQAWKENDNISFNFHNVHDINNIRHESENWPGTSPEQIKRKLRERMENTSVFVLLVGEHTKYLYRYVRWEIELALEMELPIIVVNLNKKKVCDDLLCPAILRDELAIHVAYGQKIIDYALNNWPSSHNSHKMARDSGSYWYKMKVYKNIYPDYMNEIYTLEDSDEFHSLP